MVKILSVMMIIPILFCFQSIKSVDLFSEATMIEIYSDGQQMTLTESEMAKFEDLFCKAIEGARQMPAFGVSIDELTKQAMTEGYWVKFIFSKTMTKSQMYFDELVIEISPDCQGINVIRGNDGVYNGRCYHLDLNGTLDDVYNFLQKLDSKVPAAEIELESQEPTKIEIVSDGKDDDEGDKKNIVISLEPEPKDEELSKSQQQLLEHLE